MKIYISIFLFHHLFPLEHTCSVSAIERKIKLHISKNALIELIKRRSKVHGKNISHERTLTFDQGRLAKWLATCAWKSKVSGLSPAASYVQR